MSVFEKFFAGWRFRTSKPALTPGSEVNVFINRYDEATGTGVARIGDTLLYVDDTGPEHVGLRARVRVTDFDESNASGEGEFVEVVGESSYAG